MKGGTSMCDHGQGVPGSVLVSAPSPVATIRWGHVCRRFSRTHSALFFTPAVFCVLGVASMWADMIRLSLFLSVAVKINGTRCNKSASTLTATPPAYVAFWLGFHHSGCPGLLLRVRVYTVRGVFS